MTTSHTIQEGECISSIAFEHGTSPDTIWNLEDNAKLKKQRGDSHVLLPGDVLTVPDVSPRGYSGDTGRRYRFVRKGVLTRVQLKLLFEGVPLANMSYVLAVDGQSIRGETDGSGLLVQTIPANAKRGRLLLGEQQEEYFLEFGCLDPITETTGIQARLNNLGYQCGPVDGKLGPNTEGAVMAFQRVESLEMDGKPTPNTIARLRSAYGC